jgi:hypothetical protein
MDLSKRTFGQLLRHSQPLCGQTERSVELILYINTSQAFKLAEDYAVPIYLKFWTGNATASLC